MSLLSHSKPYDLIVHLFAPVWQKSPRYTGMKYPRGNHDFSAAKEFLQINPDIFDRVDEFQSAADLYFKDKYQGWTEQNHPCWCFLRNYTRYFRSRPLREVKSPETIHRSFCSDHPTVELQGNQVCALCFPLCGKCKKNHAKEETCVDAAQREEQLKRMFGSKQVHGDGNPMTISGKKAFDKSTMKTIQEEKTLRR